MMTRPENYAYPKPGEKKNYKYDWAIEIAATQTKSAYAD